MLKKLNLYRIAAVIMFLFFLGHTLGGVLFYKSSGPAEDSVIAAMKTVHFNFNGKDCTYYSFLTGYGWITAIFLFFLGFLLWQFGGVKTAEIPPSILWVLFGCLVCVAIISWECFGIPPGIFGLLAAGLVGLKNSKIG